MKIIFYLCVAEQSANILDESVFALSVTENVAISVARDNEQHSSLV